MTQESLHVEITNLKIMLITFFDIMGTVHFEFMTQGQTVNQTYCMGIFDWLHEAVRRKRNA
jgi:hypothetical protein